MLSIELRDDIKSLYIVCKISELSNIY